MRVRLGMWAMAGAAFLAACGKAPTEPDVAPSLAVATPGGVSDLRVTGTTDSRITIQWTQVDDGTGRPASYRVKYSPPPIDWKTATIGCSSTIFGTAIGAQMQCTITGLQPGSTYEIQLMSFRIVNGFWQGAKYSNIASGTTQGSSPPRVVTDLRATDVDPTEVDLTWTQVDDGTGYPAWYRVKYSTPPIDWKTATIGCNRVRGDRIGWPISCTIAGLTPGTAYEIRLMSYKLVNGAWTNARYSNVLSVTTPPANSSFVSIAQRTDLQPLPGATDAVGADVNRHGVVVGTSGGRPVVWENGTPRELPVISGSSGTSASSINDTGEIVGTTTLSNGDVRVVLWKNGTVTQIGTLPGYRHSDRPHVNSAGAIVGQASDAMVNATKRAGFRWENGAMTALSPPAGYDLSLAVASNGAGLVTGVGHASSSSTFVIWNSQGQIIWTHSSRPQPVPDGNETWIGISEASDAFIRNTDVGGLWRWRAGQVAGWPGSENDADGLSVSVGGLVVGATMVDWNYVERGLWNPAGQFFAFDDQTASCFDISDGYVLCGQKGFGRSWIAKLDF